MPPISVPQPKTFGPLGNLPQLNFEEPVQSLVKLAEEYGPIFRMEYPGEVNCIFPVTNWSPR